MTTPHKNGCHNRRDFVTSYPVQDGYTRTAKLKSVPHRMAKDCPYSIDPLVGSKDPACVGCKHKQTPLIGETSITAGRG